MATATTSEPAAGLNAGPEARIDLAALRHNLGVVRAHAPASRVWAVIKADAYGHGAGRAAAVLADADGFALARVHEALALRRVGVHKPLLVLEGFADADELSAAVVAGLALAVHDPWQIELLEHRLGRLPPTPPLALWLKVDTGMGRLGLQPGQTAAAVARLRRLEPSVRLAGLMTHLANADDPEHPLTAVQCGTARRLAGEHGLPLSIGNSAGILAHAAARTDWVRPGIMLYGATPMLNATAEALGLRPVMTLTSRLIAVRRLERGAAVGYGSTFVCPEAMTVGVVAIGYADGYPRHAPPGTPVLVHGRRAPLIGRVSMDMVTIDLRGVPEAAAGDVVTLWGEGLPVEEIAARVGTINYELLCRLSPRVRVVHLDADGDGGDRAAAGPA
jgi:alanine racemase